MATETTVAAAVVAEIRERLAGLYLKRGAAVERAREIREAKGVLSAENRAQWSEVTKLTEEICAAENEFLAAVVASELNAAGIATKGSSCGDAAGYGRVSLQDGRELLVKFTGI